MSRERRSYFAATVEAAIAEARIELGDDAFLVDTRRLAGEGDAALAMRSSSKLTIPRAPRRGLLRTIPHGPMMSDVAGLKRDCPVTDLLKHLAAAAHRSIPTRSRGGELAEAGPGDLSSQIRTGSTGAWVRSGTEQLLTPDVQVRWPRRLSRASCQAGRRDGGAARKVVVLAARWSGKDHDAGQTRGHPGRFPRAFDGDRLN